MYTILDHVISQLDDNSGEFAIGLLKELARAYLTATSSDNTRAQVCTYYVYPI